MRSSPPPGVLRNWERLSSPPLGPPRAAPGKKLCPRESNSRREIENPADGAPSQDEGVLPAFSEEDGKGPSPHDPSIPQRSISHRRTPGRAAGLPKGNHYPLDLPRFHNQSCAKNLSSIFSTASVKKLKKTEVHFK